MRWLRRMRRSLRRARESTGPRVPVSPEIDWASAWRTDGKQGSSTRPHAQRRRSNNASAADGIADGMTEVDEETIDVADAVASADGVDLFESAESLDLRSADDDLWGRVIERAGLNRPRTQEETD